MTATEGLAQVNTLATHTALTVWSASGNFLVLLALTGAFFLFAWYVGRGPLVALLLSLYAAYAVYIAFPYASLLPSAPLSTAPFAHIGVYAALILVFYIILRRVVVSDFLYIGIFGIAALSFLGAAFLIALGYHIFAVTGLYQFTPAVATLFAPNQYFFWWFAAPAIGLFFLAR